MIEEVGQPDIAVIGILVECHWRDLHQKVPEAWSALFARADELPIGARFLEVSIAIHNGKYRELVGALATGATPVPLGMYKLIIPANRYLRLVHDGPLEDIAQDFRRMLDHAEAKGLPVNDIKLDIGYAPGLPAGRHELYVGLEPFAAPSFLV